MRVVADTAPEHNDAETTSTPEVDSTPSVPNATEASSGAGGDSADSAPDQDVEHRQRKSIRGRKRLRSANARKTSKPTIDDDAGAAEPEADADSEQARRGGALRRINWLRVLAYGVLPAMAFLLAIAAAYFKWQESSAHLTDVGRGESMATAKDATVALLSYQPDTADKTLVAARDRLTGSFKDAYTQLTQNVVIPGAKQQHVSVDAKVVGVASVSATPTHAVALLFVNQSSVVGSEKPTDLASTIRVTTDKVDGRWLVSGFEPI